MDTNDPHWTTSITVDYMFEICQDMTIKVFHSEGKSKPMTEESKHTLLGEVNFLLSDLMRAGSGLSLKLVGGRNTLV